MRHEWSREGLNFASTASGLAPKPLVTGADLIAAGLEPGARFGQMLDQLYDAQLEGGSRPLQRGLEMAKSILL